MRFSIGITLALIIGATHALLETLTDRALDR